jgi:hypothetical protein
MVLISPTIAQLSAPERNATKADHFVNPFQLDKE